VGKQILELVDLTKPEFPESYWQAYSNTPPTTFRPWNKSSGENFKKYTQRKYMALLKYREQLKQKVNMAKLHSTTPLPELYHTTPEPTTTTFRPRDEKSGETIRQYRLAKVAEFGRIWRLMKKEQKMAEESYFDTSADLYVHNREKRFIQLVKIATDNAYEIQQLKSKCQEMSNGHNMLVRVTQQHDVDLRQMKESLASIHDVIDLMAEYNPGLIQLQTSEQLNIFEDMVTIIANAIQQLHHRRLAVDLLTPKQMEIMHQAVTFIAARRFS
jgi:hypothetical protein